MYDASFKLGSFYDRYKDLFDDKVSALNGLHHQRMNYLKSVNQAGSLVTKPQAP